MFEHSFKEVVLCVIPELNIKIPELYSCFIWGFTNEILIYGFIVIN